MTIENAPSSKLTPRSRVAAKPALIRSSDELLINLLIRLSYGNAGIAQR
jgi:hypothetical protein